MGRPMDLPTPREVVGWLHDIRREMDEAVRQLAEADAELSAARERETVAKARVLIELGDDGTVAWREAQAIVRTEELRFVRVLAEQQHRAAKERVKNVRDHLDAVRSVNSAVNAEWRAQMIGQPA